MLISIPLQLVGIVVLAVYLPIHKFLVQKGIRKTVKLPYFLRWFDNADIYIGRNAETYLNVFGSTTYALYTWLAFRNPLNYFGYKVLGVEVNSVPKVIETNYQYLVGDNTGKTEGFFYQELTVRGKRYYEYYYIKKWSPTKCLRFRLGYKFGKPYFQYTVQQVIVLQFYKSYSGL
jgi:hypothetical protein